MLHGIGIGFATSQLTNVVLSDIPPQKAGSASGAAAMVRQVGTALGIALIGAIFVSQAHSHVRHDLASIPGLPTSVENRVVDSISQGGPSGPAAGASGPAADRLQAVGPGLGGRRVQAGCRVRRRRRDDRRAAVARSCPTSRPTKTPSGPKATSPQAIRR